MECGLEGWVRVKTGNGVGTEELMLAGGWGGAAVRRPGSAFLISAVTNSLSSLGR